MNAGANTPPLWPNMVIFCIAYIEALTMMTIYGGRNIPLIMVGATTRYSPIIGAIIAPA
jgi:hypothetical protein